MFIVFVRRLKSVSRFMFVSMVSVFAVALTVPPVARPIDDVRARHTRGRRKISKTRLRSSQCLRSGFSTVLFFIVASFIEPFFFVVEFLSQNCLV